MISLELKLCLTKSMKSINYYLENYAVSHQHPSNKKIHYVCVPLILFSILGLLHQVIIYAPYSLASLLFLGAMVYYSLLNVKASMVMLVFGGLSYVLVDQISQRISPTEAIAVFLSIFVLSWIGQFIGHKIEGKKPSFFEDLQYLLIGPLWILPKPILDFIKK